MALSADATGKSGQKFAKELRETVAWISARGKGILAADESTGTIGKRFEKINLENNVENRRAYRELLFTTPGDWQNFIGGVILYEETLDQATHDGIPFVEVLKKKGVIPGIKTDKGTTPIPGTNGETSTQGLDGLAARCKTYYDKGARFCKWRAVINIGPNEPTELAIQENAWGLARYAAISQENGLAPIVEPEVLMDGTHSIEKAAAVTERVLAVVIKALHDNNVFLEGCFLKPNMVLAGTEVKPRPDPQTVAKFTVRTLQRTIPASIGGIMFLSGGQSEEEATLNLNAMNLLDTPKPWNLSFSYGRALQGSVLAAWKGKPEHVAEAQKVFYRLAEANSQAQHGQYKGGAGSTDSLHVKNYTY